MLENDLNFILKNNYSSHNSFNKYLSEPIIDNNVETLFVSDFKYKNHLLSENNILNHINKIYLYELENECKKAAVYTTSIMRYAIKNGNVKYIQKFIKSLDKKYLSSWSLIALLRSIYVCKNDIKDWSDLINYSKSKIDSERLDYQKELYGLIN